MHFDITFFITYMFVAKVRKISDGYKCEIKQL